MCPVKGVQRYSLTTLLALAALMLMVHRSAYPHIRTLVCAITKPLCNIPCPGVPFWEYASSTRSGALCSSKTNIRRHKYDVKTRIQTMVSGIRTLGCSVDLASALALVTPLLSSVTFNFSLPLTKSLPSIQAEGLQQELRREPFLGPLACSLSENDPQSWNTM